MNFLEEAKARGYYYQCTNHDKLTSLLENQTTAYLGFDCTADCLHIGSLLQLMLLRLFKKHGHKIVVLMGDGTTKIGDPSGKDAMRKFLNDEEIAKNSEGIKKIITSIVGDDIIFEYNSNWLTNLNYIEFLRDIGSLFSVNRMLTFESIKARLEREQNLSFIEFNYMLLQSYDFTKLYEKHNCLLQFGGSDQWGNIVAGIELCRKLNNVETIGMTTPLLTNSEGKKMGKTANGAVWLGQDKTTSYELWQYFRNIDDENIEKFLYFFTDLPIEEVKSLIFDIKENKKNINNIKKILANEVVRVCHGIDASQKAENIAIAEFEKEDSSILPVHCCSEQEIALKKILVDIGFLQSSSDAKRNIKNGAIKINDQVIIDQNYKLVLNKNEKIKISFGKRRINLQLN
ncbi:MAG: tyrosine--tRNA ligase [Candidatus Heimdallarchaeota archaeon]|nr:tyrosine--tRNA ligase [Candidatus Heimdallarchaeota archaeon]